MEELIKYLLNQKNYTVKYIEKRFLTQEVKNILMKYNLNLHELCYRIKKNIPLDKEFKCKYCGNKINNIWKNKEFCCNNHSVTFRNKCQDNKDKVKNTNLLKYGGVAPLSSDAIKEKVKNTCLNKYGVDNYTKTDECKIKTKQTCLNKYGVDNPSKSKLFKDKYNIIQEAIKITCRNKYKAECWAQSLDHKKRSKFIYQKRYTTLKKNNSFNKSNEEEQVYKLFLTILDKNNIIRQYKSEKYPFACDFYIKSLDLYIEYNGHWTHGKEPFDKNNLEHIKILNLWKFKNTKFYRNAIYVWTVLDPLKLKIATENKLNYKIFWNLDEVKKFIGGV